MNKILIADDEPWVAELLYELLKEEYEVVTADNGLTAWAYIKREKFDIVLLDIRMPRMSGLSILKKIKESGMNIISIIITAAGDVNTAVEVMKAGAYDFIAKPFDNEKIKITVKHAIENLQLEKEIKNLRGAVDDSFGFERIIGTSAGIQNVLELCRKVADKNVTLMITGESGTGKELVARAVHYNSPRRNCPFIAIDCAAIPETLIENEFFGHEKGAFTGAYSRINGKFELADQGSIFLDEIGNLSLDVQAKLLRVLQEKEITRIGGSQKIKVDVRIICATNSDLQRAIIEGSFRDDLYYRINVIPIRLPALRERNNDIQLLANHFLNRYNKELNKKIKIDGSAMKILNSFSWPGNVRELDNYIHRLVVENEDGLVVEKNLPYFFKRKGKSETYNFPDNFTLRKIEEIYIGKILKQQKNNISKAARVLGISRKTLHNKLKLME